MLGFLPTQLEESLSRRKVLLGESYLGTTSYAQTGSPDHKSAAFKTSQGGKDQGGVKLENPGNPEGPVEAEDNAGQENEDNQPAVMTNNNVQGGQLSVIPVFTGTRGLDALTYAEAIDGTIPQAQAAATRGGPAVASWVRGEKAAGTT